MIDPRERIVAVLKNKAYTQQGHINYLIDSNDIRALVSIEVGGGHPCGCMGPQNGDPVCPCRMPRHVLHQMVDVEQLFRGNIVRR